MKAVGPSQPEMLLLKQYRIRTKKHMHRYGMNQKWNFIFLLWSKVKVYAEMNNLQFRRVCSRTKRGGQLVDGCFLPFYVQMWEWQWSGWAESLPSGTRSGSPCPQSSVYLCILESQMTNRKVPMSYNNIHQCIQFTSPPMKENKKKKWEKNIRKYSGKLLTGVL